MEVWSKILPLERCHQNHYEWFCEIMGVRPDDYNIFLPSAMAEAQIARLAQAVTNVTTLVATMVKKRVRHAKRTAR